MAAALSLAREMGCTGWVAASFLAQFQAGRRAGQAAMRERDGAGDPG